MNIKEYSFNFNRLVELLGGCALSKITMHLQRSNPEEHGQGSTYKYHCPHCQAVWLSVHRYKLTFQIDIDNFSGLCNSCTALIIQLNIGDLS